LASSMADGMGASQSWARARELAARRWIIGLPPAGFLGRSIARPPREALKCPPLTRIRKSHVIFRRLAGIPEQRAAFPILASAV
jgi:hypothetical protein